MNNIGIKKISTFTGHRDPVYALSPSFEPSRFFSAAGDGYVVLWDINRPEEGELVARLPNSIYALHYIPTKDVLIAGHNYDGIHVLDWRNKKEAGSIKFTTAALFSVVSDGDRLFAGTADGTVTSISLATLEILNRKKASDQSARCIALHKERGEIAVGYSDQFIRILDVDSLEEKYAWHAHTNSVFSLSYSPHGNLLLSGSRDARLKSWAVHDEYRLDQEIVAHMYAINHIDFSPDTKHFVTCSLDKTIKVWDAKAFQLLKVIDRARHGGHSTSVNRMLWTHHENLLLSASDDRTIAMWQIIF